MGGKGLLDREGGCFDIIAQNSQFILEIAQDLQDVKAVASGLNRCLRELADPNDVSL